MEGTKRRSGSTIQSVRMYAAGSSASSKLAKPRRDHARDQGKDQDAVCDINDEESVARGPPKAAACTV
jgi:hypothetical protein